MVRAAPERDEFNGGDVYSIAKGTAAQARRNFLDFRKLVHPNLLDAWWQRDVAKHLTLFFIDLKAGKRPSLILQAPPQHGKSEQMIDFIAWVAGQNPNLKTIFASYSDDLGIRDQHERCSGCTRRPRYQLAFGRTRINTVNVSTRSGRWMRNSSLLEYVGFDGSFRNTTVMGQINGLGLDLGVIDDPMKGRAEAQSKTVRDKTWNWFTDDFFGRFSDHAGFVMIHDSLAPRRSGGPLARAVSGHERAALSGHRRAG